MPENTPMKMQWINIDGRSTPIVLPQIWDHEKQDWIVTGTENPLPTQVTGSNVELLGKWNDFECPSSTNKALDFIDVSEFKDLFIHFTPNGLDNYDIRLNLRRLDRNSLLSRVDIEERRDASNGSSERFTANSTHVAVVIRNNSSADHIFGEIILAGVRR